MNEKELSTEQGQSLDVFICKTHLSKEKAIEFLKECSWNVSAALKKFELECNKEDTVTPSTSTDRMSCCEPPGFAFCLPDLDRFAPDFRDFLEKDLIETPTQRRLENSKHLNWWLPYGQKLYPLSTTGDGNCLLHAASLGIWGVHDRQLTLREALYEMLMRGSRRGALWRRWKWAEHKAYAAIGLCLSEDEWIGEWNNNIVAIASPVPRKTDDTSLDSNDQIYESLEAIHVFALAHVLKRPIIVVSDTILRNAKGEELSPVPFGGVYLPLECPPEQCHRSPLVLCYDSAHFSPLVPMRHDSSQPQIIPITDVNRNLLPLHFVTDPGSNFTWWKSDEDTKTATTLELNNSDRLTLMSKYMDLVRLDVRRGSIKRTLPIRSASSVGEKSLTLANSGVANDTREKKRILEEIRQQFAKTLRLSGRKNKQDGIDANLCAADISRTSCIVAARLIASTHEYMEEMVREYMKTAKERFQNNNQNNGRKRMSRSFSASSIPITCINQSCVQPASALCNFLCQDCFEHQKEMMMSFNCEKARVYGLPVNPKSSTMPSISPKSSTSSGRQSPILPCKQIFSTVMKREIPKPPSVLGVVKQGFITTTTISKIEGENGVTHYFVAGEEPSRASSCANAIMPTHSTTLQQQQQLAL